MSTLKPKSDETQTDYLARALAADAEADAGALLTQFRNSAKGCKVLDESKGLLGGWGIPFGGPIKSKNHPAGLDLDGEYFDAKTDFCFDWFPSEGRPVLYDHGTNGEVGLQRVGLQASKFVDPTNGVWVEVQLDLANKYATYILELAKKGVLAYSSGALGGYVQRASDGHIKRWPYIEQTVTVRPANPYALIPAEAVKHFEGIDLPEPIAEAAKARIIVLDGVTYEATPVDAKSTWTTAYVDALPDSAFAIVDDNGRHLPHHDSGGAVDEPHLVNAVQREPQTNLSAPDHTKAKSHLDAHEKALGIGPYASGKKLTLPDGMSLDDLRTKLEDAIEEVAGITGDAWVVDVRDGSVVASIYDGDDTDTYRFPFSLAADGTATITGPGEEVESQVTWNAVTEAKAGRVMSARNMGQLHGAMKAMSDLHTSTCDMGADCPMADAADTPGAKPDEGKKLEIPDLETPEKKARREEIDRYLATIKVGGNNHA